MIKKTLLSALLVGSIASAAAADYVIDTRGAHASIEFKVSHLGYSWTIGRFNTFSGTIYYDASQPEASKLNVTIDTTSLDSNHAERDRHLRGDKFLNTQKYPEATFTSTAYSAKDDTHGTLSGELTLNGITKSIDIEVNKVGEGQDPWGGYRIGFSGTAEFDMQDFNMQPPGPKSNMVYLALEAEAIKQ